MIGIFETAQVYAHADNDFSVQTSSQGGSDYCKRKVNFLRDQIQKVIQVSIPTLQACCGKREMSDSQW